MSKSRERMTVRERRAVKRFLVTMLDHSIRAADKLREIDQADRPPFVDKNIVYWDNVRSGFRWAIAQLRHY
jgi:hypothetical protein